MSNKTVLGFCIGGGKEKLIRQCCRSAGAEYRSMVPSDVLFVSESGIKNHADIQALRDNGTDAVLIGETLMRATDKKAMLENLKSGTTI